MKMLFVVMLVLGCLLFPGCGPYRVVVRPPELYMVPDFYYGYPGYPYGYYNYYNGCRWPYPYCYGPPAYWGPR